jgi:hypothetical protein
MVSCGSARSKSGNNLRGVPIPIGFDEKCELTQANMPKSTRRPAPIRNSAASFADCSSALGLAGSHGYHHDVQRVGIMPNSSSATVSISKSSAATWIVASEDLAGPWPDNFHHSSQNTDDIALCIGNLACRVMGWLLRKAQTFAARRGVGYHSAPRPSVAVVRRCCRRPPSALCR